MASGPLPTSSVSRLVKGLRAAGGWLAGALVRGRSAGLGGLGAARASGARERALALRLARSAEGRRPQWGTGARTGVALRLAASRELLALRLTTTARWAGDESREPRREPARLLEREATREAEPGADAGKRELMS